MIDRSYQPAHTVRSQVKEDRKPMWDIPDDVPLFTMRTVARAVGAATPTIHAWFQRGHVTLGKADTKAHNNGSPSKFTLRSVLMLAVTGELVRLGGHPAYAFKCAQHWMDFGALEGEEGAPGRREPGGLFASPLVTFLIAGTEEESATESVYPCRIEGINPRDPRAYSALYSVLFFRGRSSAKVVLLNLIYHRVRQICLEATFEGNAPPEPDWEAVVAKMLSDQ